MEIRPIRTEKDYSAALALVEKLMERPESDALAADRIEVLVTLIKAWEAEHHPIGHPTPLGAIRFWMEQKNLAAKDLERAIGSQSKVSEVLNGKRSLSLSMIVGLHRELGIPYESLIDPGVKRKPRGASASRSAKGSTARERPARYRATRRRPTRRIKR